MVHIHLQRSNGEHPDVVVRWLGIGIMIGLILVELAACAWIVYKIVSPKY